MSDDTRRYNPVLAYNSGRESNLPEIAFVSDMIDLFHILADLREPLAADVAEARRCDASLLAGKLIGRLCKMRDGMKS